MAQEPSKSDSVVAPSRSKDAIIAAIATVLAAVIAAAAGIIVSARHEKTNLESEITNLQAQVDTKTREARTIAASMGNLQNEVHRLQSTATSARPTGDQAQARGTQATTSATPAEPPPPVTRSLSAKDLTIGFQRCIRTGSSTTCQFLITNDGGEREVAVYASASSDNSRAVDDHGKQQVADSAEIAGVGGTSPAVDVPSKITVPAFIRFSDLPADVKQFKVLDIVFDRYSNKRSKVSLRDVPIAGAE
jgi:endonuclease/exonuclease/phosphatase (EEP) superfamily protein YafD